MSRNSNIFQALKSDHKHVSDLFAKLEETTTRAVKKRSELYAQLKEALVQHTKAEEQAVYPALYAKRDTKEMGLEADEEHHVVDDILARLDTMQPDDERWKPTLTVLKEVVEHHVKEEEKEIFKEMRSNFDKETLDAINQRFIESKAEQGMSAGL